MTWATNPLFIPGEHDLKIATENDAQLQHGNGDTPDSAILTPEEREFKAPTSHLTRRQAIYIFILDGLVAGLLGAGINTGIAYGTYHTQDAVRLFILPNALAADAGFTLLAQFIITWIVECFIVSFHLRKGLVPPIGFFREPKNRFIRWYFILDQKQPKELKGVLPWLTLIISNAIRSLILLAAFFPVVFGASIGFLTLVGTRKGADWYFGVVWAPQVFKAIFGVAVGSTCTPLMAGFFLLRCGWILKARANESEMRPVEEITSP